MAEYCEVCIELEPSTDESAADEESYSDGSSCLSHHYSSSPFEGDVSGSGSDSSDADHRVTPYLYEPENDISCDTSSSSEDDSNNEERLLNTDW